MKTPSVLLLAGALVLAGGAALLARVLMAPAPAPAPVVQAAPEPPKPAVLALARDLQPGQFIDYSALTWQQADRDMPTLQYYTRDQDDMSLVVGATVRTPMRAGQALSSTSVVRADEPGFLGAVLKPGMRALSLPTSAVAAGAGLVAAGDRVDVILSLNQDALAGLEAAGVKPFPPPLAAQTLLRDVRVLALDRTARSDITLRDPKREAAAVKPRRQDVFFDTVTLEVTPRQAERLALSKEIGVVQLALRSSREVTKGIPQSGTRDVTRLAQAADLYPAPSAAVPPIMLYRGTKVEAVEPFKH